MEEEEEEEEARTRQFAILAVAAQERSAIAVATTVLGSVPEDVSVVVLEALGTPRFVVGVVAGQRQSAVSGLHSKVLMVFVEALRRFVVESAVARQEVRR